MRKASELPETSDSIMRATFEVPRSLVEEFRQLAKRHERTFSQELRQVMRDELAREKQSAA
jgi:hypothetical protein